MSIQTDDDPREYTLRLTLVEELVEVAVDRPTRMVRSGATLSTGQAEQVTELPVKFKELFV